MSTIAALTKIAEAYDAAPPLFAGTITVVLAMIGGAFWLSRALESAEKKSLVAQNAFLTLQLNDTKDKAERTAQDLAALKTQIEELKQRDPGVGRELDASIDRAQTSNNSVTDTITAAAKYLVDYFGAT